MCLKICEHRDIQITYKILWLRFLNTLVFRIFSLLSREVVFLIVFMKNMADPLGVNE